ncbi:MAG: shikimate kinase [Clostridia bacterium]|nr:shikimate kinase [Clostridia bacterium]
MSAFFGLIGRHLSHSYSKMIHSEMGCRDYCHKELEPEELEGFLKGHVFGGLNVTIPYKKDVMPFCEKLTDEAKGVGCVNTIVTDKDGLLSGHNTDVDGFLWMAKNAKVELKDKKVIILGSGGAQLAVRHALKKAEAKEVITVSRSGENNYENLSRHYDADVIVNATPVGMYPHSDESPIDLSPFKNCSGVLDLIYNPFRTNLLVQAEELSIPSANGLSMLVAQALYAEEFFKGKKLDEKEIPRIMKIISNSTRNIVLVGMPGSGKSTAGKLLAELSGKELIDTDEEIVKDAEMTIPEIFEKGGETLFRKLENEAVIKASAGFGKIIVTGGGAVKTDANFLPLKRTSRVYHLERAVSSLPRDGRPLSKNADLEKMYIERLPLYTRFRDEIINVQLNARDTAELIWRDFCENSCN